MKLLGHQLFHKSLLLGLSAIALHSACSNSNFRGASNQAQVEPASSEDASVDDPVVTSSPIGSSDLAIPAALKPRPDSIYASYPTTVVKSAETQFTLDLKDISSTVKLEDKTAPKTDKFTQNTRTPTDSLFVQGTPGETKADNFTQNGKKGLVDILVVVDNSGSMAEEQTNLSTKLNELLVAIKDADWQVSVINTSPVVPAGVDMNNANSEGKETCVSTLIRKADGTAAADFAKAVQAGITGNGNEQGIRQAVVGLRCPEKPVVRAGSSLAVLIVSDEDNCSLDGGDCGSLPWAKETYLINYVENTLKRTVGKDAGFYGIVAPSKALCSTAGNPAPQYIRLFDYKSTAGVNYGNICDGNYKTTLNRISENIALLLDSAFELTVAPDAGTLSVSTKSATGVVATVNPNDYTLTQKTLKFNAGKEPANGSTITASYRIGVKPMFTSVTLPQDPAAGTITASINGAATTGFTANGRVITFAAQPPANAMVKIGYRLNTALFDKFKLNNVPINGTVAVRVNNAATANFTFDAGTNQVVLGAFPLDGQSIDVDYTTVDGPRLTYPVSISAGAKNFRLLDGATALTFTLDAASTPPSVTINQANYQVAKTLVFTYEIPDGAERKFPLIATPEAGSVAVNMVSGTCALNNGIKIVGADLIATCPVTQKTEFVLSYKYKSLQKAFTISGIPDPEKGVWSVYYNGELETDYTRSGSTITLNFEPALDSKVDISYTFPE